MTPDTDAKYYECKTTANHVKNKVIVSCVWRDHDSAMLLTSTDYTRLRCPL